MAKNRCNVVKPKETIEGKTIRVTLKHEVKQLYKLSFLIIIAFNYMSDQRPFPPYPHPYYFPYPPPPFPNYHMPFPHKNAPNHIPPEHMLLPPYAMPPYNFPPPQMLYPPPPPHYYPFNDRMPPHRQPPYMNTQRPLKEFSQVTAETKPSFVEKPKAHQKETKQVVVVSDSEEKKLPAKNVQFVSKKNYKAESKKSKQIGNESKLRRTIRKVVPIPKPEPTIPRKQYCPKKKEKQVEESKVKKSNIEDKEVKIVENFIQDTHYESFNRSSRAKLLTAKDGRGKILVGEDYQAIMPDFMQKNEYFTVWSDEKKRGLFSRSIK